MAGPAAVPGGGSTQSPAAGATASRAGSFMGSMPGAGTAPGSGPGPGGTGPGTAAAPRQLQPQAPQQLPETRAHPQPQHLPPQPQLQLAAAVQPSAQQQVRRRQGQPDGFPGQRWKVLASKDFCDVIVRETEEVSSKEMRRILPNDFCVQRGPTLELPNGLVRMPVHPDGWVTVHARHIGGPTFMEEEDGGQHSRQASGSAAAPTPATQPTQAGMSAPGAAAAAGFARPPPQGTGAVHAGTGALPRSTTGRTEAGKGAGLLGAQPASFKDDEDPWGQVDDRWTRMGGPPPPRTLQALAEPSWPGGGSGPRYERRALLVVRNLLAETNQLVSHTVGTAGLRILHIPLGETRTSRRERRDERRERHHEEDDDRHPRPPPPPPLSGTVLAGLPLVGLPRDRTPLKGDTLPPPPTHATPEQRSAISAFLNTPSPPYPGGACGSHSGVPLPPQGSDEGRPSEEKPKSCPTQ